MDKNAYQKRINEIKNYMCSQGLYVAGKDDIDKIAFTGADALWDDPSTQYIIGRHANIENMAAMLRVSFLSIFDRIMLVSDSSELNSMLCVSVPPITDTDVKGFLLSGGAKLPHKIGLMTIPRAIKYENNCTSIMNRLCDMKSTYYLNYFCVKKNMQHNGIGSELMYPLLDFLDLKGYNIYLETHKKVNVEIYKHYGFDVKSIDSTPDKKSTQWALLRKAKSKNAE